MKKILALFLITLGILLVFAFHVGIAAGRELQAARAVLGDVRTAALERADLVDARLHVRRAHQHLTSLPARALGLVPLARQNVRAAESLTESLIEVLDVAVGLRSSLQELDEAGLWRQGRIDVAAVSDLSEPVLAQARALEDLVAGSASARTGWLLPPVWDAIDDVVRTYGPDADNARHLAELLEHSEDLLGATQTRRYLVMLVNNAELRGAGGILSGVGSLELADGRLSLGSFHSVHSLREKPYDTVAAPADFKRRFGVYRADTTLWLNATFSPDLPDAALVASRLFRKTTGTATDGAIVVDPRGLEALAGTEGSFRFEALDLTIPRSKLAEFVYSDVYRRFSDQVARRLALLEAGRRAFAELQRQNVSLARLEAIGRAAAAGHLRMVSFEPGEQAALAALAPADELSSPAAVDSVRVTAQNFGSTNGQGTKLDHWVDRRVAQVCDIRRGEAACATGVELENRAPGGLGEYVGGRPYGVLRTLVEVYIPASARVTEVTLDERAADARMETEEDQRSVGVFLRLARGERARLRVDYTLGHVEDGLTLRMLPQPLSRDARLSLRISAPDGWKTFRRGQGGSASGISLTTDWDRPVEVRAMPDRRSGLPGAWRTLMEFWSEPL